jgi:hypothetical protein
MFIMSMYSSRSPSLIAILSLILPPSIEAESIPKLIEVRKIWDQAPHNAFTDLVRFKDEWFCVFREGKSHVSPDGALRVIVSKNGEKWQSAALLTSDDSDLRDAKINLTPDGRLMLSGAEAMHERSKYSHQSLTWFSKDGRVWSKAHEVGDRDFWLWRTTWRKDNAYGFGYGTNKKSRSIRLYRSQNGCKFEILVKNAFDKGYPNETSIVFLPDETALCLLRRDSHPITAQLGQSKPPYIDWNWKDLGVRIGGPHLMRLPDGRFVAVVRRYDGVVRTSLHWLDPEKATLTEFLKLPSRSDTSYAGLAWYQNLLWISYYSSHEGKTSIYLAKVQFPERR